MPSSEKRSQQQDDPTERSGEKKKKRRSRWAQDEMEKTFIPGMPTTLPADASDEQKEQYLLQLQIEEKSRRLRSGDLGIPANPEDRSPSPEPIYNNEGKRMNTREYRVRKQLEEDRHEKIQKLLSLNPSYKPPADYKPPIIRVNDKVMIPQDDHPEINFVGLLIGPRGNTLKNLEKETGAKIIIRGKGSVKEGKIGRKDGQPLPGEDEPLHAYITANDPDNVKKAVDKIKEIISQGIEVPEGQNDLRKQQLRELALLNGTLRDNDGLAKLKQLQEAQTIITNTIICTVCGGAGHIAKDCIQKRPSETITAALVAQAGGDELPANTVVPRADRAKMDSEYMSLMAELGQSAPDSVKADFQAASMPAMRTGGSGNANETPLGARVSRFDRKEPTPSAAPPSASPSNDYGYGGRRSRFDDKGPNTRFDTYGPPGIGPGPNRFSTPPQNTRYPPPPPGPTSQGFESSYGNDSWNMTPPVRGPPPPSMMPSNRWGAPLNMPPPPPSIAPPPAPPSMSYSSPAPPPPPPTSSVSPWQQNQAPVPPNSTAPWQQPTQPPQNSYQSNPLPPWQQPPPPQPPAQSSYNPVAPPPPPPTYGGFNNYSAPPPPPPQ